jgi:hypothetical protein
VNKKIYYSVRTGKHPTDGRLDFDGLKHLFLALYRRFSETGHFQQALGFSCVDAGEIPGSVGRDVEAFFFLVLKKRALWPIPEQLDSYSEDDLFDVIEVLHDCSSRGIDGRYHSWAECGWHYETFDQQAGQNDFRAAINDILREYDGGYQLSPHGEILSVAPVGLGDLERAPAPPGHPDDVQARMAAAADKFRCRGATLDQRRDAVRDLADILEYLRPSAKSVLQSADEGDLFSLANNFGIRHHNQRQKNSYDKSIWLSWMFYHYLATIHAVTRLIERAASKPCKR